MVRVRPLFSQDDYVCDLKFVMRTRLLLGLYNNMYTPKKLQIWTRLYCLVITIFLIYSLIDLCVKLPSGFDFCFNVTKVMLMSANMFCSLYTADSYILKFCTRANLTDCTLTSASEFLKVEKIVTYVCWILVVMKVIEVYNYIEAATSFSIFLYYGMRLMFLDLGIEMRVINQILVLTLMFCRFSILRKKLERLGFRYVRDAKFGLNVYSQMYSRTMRKINKTTTPMKVLMAFDILSNSAGIILVVCQILNPGSNKGLPPASIIYFVNSIAKMIIMTIMNAFIVEATAVEVDIIQNLVVEELMESPAEEERRAMYNLLEVISALPVRISLFRVVDVDVALALSILANCTQRIVLILQNYK